MRASRLNHYGLLALFVLIAYWPLSSLQHITRWDSIECAFAPRYFLSDCLRNGVLPFWNPYTLNGAPFYGDPQSGAWYPIAWLLTAIAPYDFRMFAIEHLLLFFTGAAGMYELVRGLRLSHPAPLLAAISYAACGFFISNAEHFTWLIAAAWLPWALWSYHRMSLHRTVGFALLNGLFLFLMFSGGYPSFFTVTAYLLLLSFLYVFLRQRGKGQWILLNAAAAFAFLLLSAGMLVSLYQVAPHITRYNALPLERIMPNPFSPRCFLSFLLPFATLKDDVFFGTDIAMRNAYIGLSSLLMLPLAWNSIRDKGRLWLMYALVIFSFAAAVGSCLPFRGWLAEYVPLMDMFRYPSFFRIFGIIGLILLAAHGFAAYKAAEGAHQRKLLWVSLILLGLFAFLLFHSVLRHGWQVEWGAFISDFKKHLEVSTRHEHAQLQAILQMLLLGLLIPALLIKRGRYFNSNLLILFCAIDMTLASSLNAFGTIVYAERARDIEQPIANAPRSFPIPDNNTPVAHNSDGHKAVGLLRSNMGIYLKLPAPDGYNPARLTKFNQFEANAIHDSVWANPYLYFADRLTVAKDSVPLPSKRALSVKTTDLEALKRISFTNDSGRAIAVTAFEPNRIAATVACKNAAMLNLQQLHFEGWHCYIDGNETKLFETNYAHMAVIVPPGMHTVQWVFRQRWIKTVGAASITAFGILLCSLFFFRRRLFEVRQ